VLIILLYQNTAAMSGNKNLQDQMYALIEEWKKEGGVQKVFCNKHEISVLKFQYWHKRYKEQKGSAGDNDPSFIKLDLPSAQTYKHSGGRAEVIFPNGTRILFHQEVSVHFLKALV
jgi:hypothetical protein